MAAETLLALWNDTPTRRAIVDFVQAVSTQLGFTLFRMADLGLLPGAVGSALDRAKTHGWTVVSMKEDWSAVFASV